MVPDAQTVAAFGQLPLPALLVFGGIVGALGIALIWVKFGHGKKAASGETFDIKLATFDPRTIAVLIQELDRNTEANADLGRDIRELTRTLDRRREP